MVLRHRGIGITLIYDNIIGNEFGGLWEEAVAYFKSIPSAGSTEENHGNPDSSPEFELDTSSMKALTR
jgi:hypothetical protein